MMSEPIIAAIAVSVLRIVHLRPPPLGEGVSSDSRTVFAAIAVLDDAGGKVPLVKPNQRFARALLSMRSRDPRLREDGFDFLREHADSYVDELIAEFEREREDNGLRGRLLELVAEARSPRALPLLASQLQSDDESLRFWAARGMEMLDTREAREELHRARANGWIV
jgi:hypothetical protein